MEIKKFSRRSFAFLAILVFSSTALLSSHVSSAHSSAPNSDEQGKSIDMKKTWSDDEIVALGYAPDEVLVMFKRDRIDLKSPDGKDKLKGFVASESNRVKNSLVNEGKIHNLEGSMLVDNGFIKARNMALLKLGSGSVQDVIAELKNSPDVEKVIPNYVVVLDTAINDPYYVKDDEFDEEYQWHLFPDKVNLEGALGELRSSPSDVIVAVLDSGIDYDHEEFDDTNLWDGSDETGDGCVDENEQEIEGGCPYHGWNFVGTNNEETYDDNGHGSKVSGIIAAKTNNQSGENYIGIAGIAPNVKIMAVKIANNIGYMYDVVEGIEFATNNGADMINASWHNPSGDETCQKAAIEAFGGLFVNSAGNAESEIFDEGAGAGAKVYPMSYDSENILTVAAVDHDDGLADESTWGSNWGSVTVDMSAPGVGIWSSVYATFLLYDYSDGTSVAAPQVTGVAALIKGQSPNLTTAQIKQILMDSGDDISAQNSYPNPERPTVSNKRLNAYKAMLLAKSSPTIHSKTTGGSWSSTSTWEEGRIPDSTDVVEINGPVTTNTSYTIAGLLVSGSGSLVNQNGYSKHIYVTGDVVNNGEIKDDTSSTYSLSMHLQGSIENNGTWVPKYTYLEGTSTRSFVGTTPIGTTGGGIYVSDSFTITGDSTLGAKTTVNGTLTVNSPDSLTFMNGFYVGTGTTAGTGTIVLGGENQDFDGGIITMGEFVLGGGGTKTMVDGMILTGSLTINNEVTLINEYGDSVDFYISGTTTNNGTITDDTSGYALFMRPSGSVESNGEWKPRYTYLEGTGARSYTGSYPIHSPSNGQIYVKSSFTVTGDSVINGNTTFDGGDITVGSGDSLTFMRGLNLATDEILGEGEIILGGGDDTFQGYNTTGAQDFGGWRITASEVTLGGTGTKSLSSSINVTADLTINSGVTLINKSGISGSVTVLGTAANNGTISDDAGSSILVMRVGGDMANNSDDWNSNTTRAYWVPEPSAVSYEFRITADGPGAWGSPVATGSSGTEYYYDITSYVEGNRQWQWRYYDGAEHSEWSEAYDIN